MKPKQIITVVLDPETGRMADVPAEEVGGQRVRKVGLQVNKETAFADLTPVNIAPPEDED